MSEFNKTIDKGAETKKEEKNIDKETTATKERVEKKKKNLTETQKELAKEKETGKILDAKIAALEGEKRELQKSNGLKDIDETAQEKLAQKKY